MHSHHSPITPLSSSFYIPLVILFSSVLIVFILLQQNPHTLAPRTTNCQSEVTGKKLSIPMNANFFLIKSSGGEPTLRITRPSNFTFFKAFSKGIKKKKKIIAVYYPPTVFNCRATAADDGITAKVLMLDNHLTFTPRGPG